MCVCVCVPATFGLRKAAIVTGARGLVPARLPSSVIRSLMYACVLAGSVCATISCVIRLRAPSSSLMPLWGPRDPCGSSSAGQDTCVFVCVCVYWEGGVRACVWQLVRFVGTLLQDGVGSVANRLGCLKV